MKTARREFLLGMMAGSMALGHGWTGGTRPLEATEVAALDAARRDAGRVRRRVIFNNDGDDIWAEGADTREKFLASRHTPLLGTNVDSIFYCTTQSFNHFTHDTRVAEIFAARTGQFANNQLATFIDQKTDGLRMSSEFALANGLETIWTLRMNDIHDAWTPAFLSKWKQQDSTRVMSTPEEAKQYNDRRRLWSLVDFEHPDVEPTNSRSERNVRREAEIRKGARTNKTAKGAKRRGIIVTVLASLQTRLDKFTLRNLLDEVGRWFNAGLSIFEQELQNLQSTRPPPQPEPV